MKITFTVPEEVHHPAPYNVSWYGLGLPVKSSHGQLVTWSTRHTRVSSHSQLVTSEHITKPPVPVVINYLHTVRDIQKQCSTRTALLPLFVLL